VVQAFFFELGFLLFIRITLPSWLTPTHKTTQYMIMNGIIPVLYPPLQNIIDCRIIKKSKLTTNQTHFQTPVFNFALCPYNYVNIHYYSCHHLLPIIIFLVCPYVSSYKARHSRNWTKVCLLFSYLTLVFSDFTTLLQS
jgi:hypothetical protein